MPVITSLSDVDELTDKSKCPLCGEAIKYLSTDIRPVFPQERLLLELLLGEAPFSFVDKSVWCQDSRYYINGKPKSISAKAFLEADTDALSKQLEELRFKNESDEIQTTFDNKIYKFVEANNLRLKSLIEEAYLFIKNEAAKFPSENIVLSFSGGKDSTVLLHLVRSIYPDVSAVFIDTGLEYPEIRDFVKK